MTFPKILISFQVFVYDNTGCANEIFITRRECFLSFHSVFLLLKFHILFGTFFLVELSSHSSIRRPLNAQYLLSKYL